MADFLRICEEAARAGGTILLDWADRFAIREKGPADVVTEADLAAQEAIRSIVLGKFPHHEFLGEEDSHHAPTSGNYRWIVDPLDGTMNYVHRVPSYCTSVALALGHELVVGAVYDPVSQECYLAERGCGAFLNGQKIQVSDVTTPGKALVAASFPPQVRRDSPELNTFVQVLLHTQGIRRTGSAALNLCYLACGRFDAFWATETHAWDIAAGMLLVREAGGIMTELDGGSINLDRPRFLAAATQPLHEDMRRILSGSYVPS
ncbi:MAG: inositol monophosphatase [Pirellulales bacterium]|nr:inositol monophosphatase [Pirellulales bacterium]